MSDSQSPQTPATSPQPRVSGQRSATMQQNAPLVLIKPEFADTLTLNPDESAEILPVPFHGLPMNVVIQSVWPNHDAEVPGHQTAVEFFVDNATMPALTTIIDSPYDPDQLFPLHLSLPASTTTTGGIRRVHYRVSSPLISPINSFGSFINIDQTKPNAGNAEPLLMLDAEIVTGGVTQPYLDLHDGIPSEVTRAADLRIDERYEFFWGHLPNLTSAGQLIITAAHVAGAPLLFTFDKNHVQNLAANPVYVSYRRTDRAGNVGEFSDVQALVVNLTPLPVLTRPDVPLAELDGLILLNDAWAPPIISIEEITGALPQDRIQLFWNGVSLPLITVGAGQLWPITRAVPWAVVSAGGFAARHPVRVRYVFMRGTSNKPSPDNFFEADLTVAGPNPAPTPINPVLEQVTVLGVGGNNIVTLADAPGPVRARVRLSNDFVPGDWLYLHWGGEATLADSHQVVAGEPGMDYSFDVLWQTIMAGGPHLGLPVYYWTDNGINRQRSVSTSVQVSIVNIIGLKAPKVLNDQPVAQYINCDSVPALYEGVSVGVEWDDLHFEIDDLLTLYWAGYPTLTGAGAPYPETVVSFDITLAAGHSVTGVEFSISPFNPLVTRPGLATLNGGSAVFYYVLRKASGAQGKSAPGFIKIDLSRPNGQTCLGPAAGV